MELQFRNTELQRPGAASALNSAARAEVADLLTQCLNVPRWVDAVAGARPFSDEDAVLTCVSHAAAPFSRNEILNALTTHPRIGDRPEGDDAHAEHARREQSGVQQGDEDVLEQIRAGNVAYEQRFGHVFLIRAAGRDASDILRSLRERLANDPDTEMAIVERELRDIAARRLVDGQPRG